MNKRNFIPFYISLGLIELAVYLSFDLILPAIPSIQEEFFKESAYFVLTSWFLGAATFQLIIGPLSDSLGRRPIVLAGGVIFCLSSLLCTSTINEKVLFLARFGQGSSTCFIIAAGYACIHDINDQKKATKILSWLGSVIILAPTFGPLIGAYLLSFLTWRGLFLPLVLISLVAIILLFIVMPESILIKKKIAPLQNMYSYGILLRNLHFMGLIICFSLLYSGMIIWAICGPLVLDGDKILDPKTFGLLQAIVHGAFIAGNTLTRRLLNQYSLLSIIIFGVLISTCISFLSLLLYVSDISIFRV